MTREESALNAPKRSPRAGIILPPIGTPPRLPANAGFFAPPGPLDLTGAAGADAKNAAIASPTVNRALSPTVATLGATSTRSSLSATPQNLETSASLSARAAAYAATPAAESAPSNPPAAQAAQPIAPDVLSMLLVRNPQQLNDVAATASAMYMTAAGTQTSAATADAQAEQALAQEEFAEKRRLVRLFSFSRSVCPPPPKLPTRVINVKRAGDRETGAATDGKAAEAVAKSVVTGSHDKTTADAKAAGAPTAAKTQIFVPKPQPGVNPKPADNEPEDFCARVSKFFGCK